MPIAYISHHDCLLHDMGDHHPEQPARLYAINDRLVGGGLDMVLFRHDAPAASKEQLLRAHDADYVEQIFAASPQQGIIQLDGDTCMCPFTLQAALHAAGAVTYGIDLVMQGPLSKAFCEIRPPGHHAERHRAMGFCLFNNVAIGAYHAIDRYGLERIAIIDFDVHHGNGTEDIVAGDGRILFCSSFQHPFYPFSGADSTAPNVVNIPLPAGSDGAVFRAEVTEKWLPRLHAFQPQLILISAGFDGHRADDMSHLKLLESDYAWITRQLVAIADQYANGRIVSTLEGGYELHALARSVEAHIRALIGPF